MKKTLIFVLIITIIFFKGFANIHITGNYWINDNYHNSIKTVQCHVKGWPLSDPVIKLNSDEVIYFSFDNLNSQPQSFYYTVKHCNSKWETSNLNEFEYIDGYYYSTITNYKNSFNTTIDYVHYSLEIPNHEIRLKSSGNYLLLISDNPDFKNIIIAQKFYIYENLLDISSEIKKPSNAFLMKTHQKINFKINIKNFYLKNPYDDLIVIIKQNFREDNQINNLKPLFVTNEYLDYSYDTETCFEGLNEFRYFDIKSTRYIAEYVDNIEFKNPYYYVYLKPCNPRYFTPYFYSKDLNGKYLIDVQEGRNPETDADYLFVNFILKADLPYIEGDVFVFGSFTGWSDNKNYKMNYNIDKKQYELTCLLKQGYYNYFFCIKNNNNFFNCRTIEGSHFETTNDYYIFVYYVDYTSKFERLIGYKKLN